MCFDPLYDADTDDRFLVGHDESAKLRECLVCLDLDGEVKNHLNQCCVARLQNFGVLLSDLSCFPVQQGNELEHLALAVRNVDVENWRKAWLQISMHDKYLREE